MAVASRFVWHDLMSTDVVRSTAFYTALFGWSTSRFEMGAYGTYTMIKNGAMDIGGILPLDPRLGSRSLWLAYVNVPSLDKTASRAVAMGSKVLVPSSDIPNVGRYAVLEDAQGGVMSPFTRYGGDNPEPEEPPPVGSFLWDELLTSDPAAAAIHYASLFRWRAHRMDTGAYGDYSIVKRGEKNTAGIGRLRSEVEGRPTWIPYVGVSDVDALAERARRLKATVVTGPADAGEFGRFAIVKDPLGAILGLFRAGEGPMRASTP